MNEINSKHIVLLERPVGIPSESAFGLEKIGLAPTLEKDELRLHGLYYSVDPYMRGRMNAENPYISPFQLHKAIEGNVVARVTETKSSKFSVGDLVVGQLPWATEMIASHFAVKKVNLKGALASESLGILGMPGHAAYFGMLQIGRPKVGDTVVISAAAGAVGLVAGQIAKLKGCHVVGIVGSSEKAKLLTEHFHFDAAINYKLAKTAENLEDRINTTCPRGIDVYFDNVGGPISDRVIQYMNKNGRIVVCGQISLYNLKSFPQTPEVEPLILSRSITMEGFSVSDYENQFPEATAQLEKWLSEGKLQSSETVVEGFENLPKAFIGLFSGKNTGKMIVKAPELPGYLPNFG